ncbi:MAG: hypothetical protein V7703_12010 [Hyphomicrobiales bacterium]
MTTIIKATASAVLAAIFCLSSISAQAAPPEGTISNTAILECGTLGGTVIKQPRGSAITACCYDDGCWICDAKGKDCSFDATALKRFQQQKPQANSGAVVVKPTKQSDRATKKPRAKIAVRSNSSLIKSLNRVPKSRVKRITTGARGMRNVNRVIGSSKFVGCSGDLCICTGDKDCNDLFSGKCSSPSSGGSCAGSGSGTICYCTPKVK